MKYVLIRPILTEKSLKLAKESNKYTFEVSRDVNKFEIKKAIERKYDVNVKNVRIINMLGKIKRFGSKRIEGRRKDFKKAIVTLDKKDKIDIFEMK